MKPHTTVAASKKKTVKSRKPPLPDRTASKAFWNLRLYVAGQTPKSLMAYANLKRLCDEHLADRHQIEVIDLSREPQRAVNDQIVALPTLVRKLPEPMKRIIGDLSNSERVKIGLDLQEL